MTVKGHLGLPTKLATFAITGQLIAYLLSIVLARQLSIEGFEAYAVASAAFILMVMIVPQGMDKYALRVLPALFERGDWSTAHSYLRYGMRQTLWAALTLAFLVGCWALYFSPAPYTTRMAIIATCLSLPCGALVHYYSDVLSSTGRADLAVSIFRIVVPSLVFALIGVLLILPIELTGALATGSWGIAWAIALWLVWLGVRRNTPPDVWRANHTSTSSAWRSEARPFWYYRITLAIVAQVGILGLEILQPSAEAVGAYAVAIATASLPLVLVTSTNRSYSRQLSILLEQKDYAGILEVRRARLIWLLPAVALFLITIFSFAHEILTFFRPAFADDGTAALQIMAVAISFSMLFALAPTYMKYMRHNRTTLYIVIAAAVVQIILLFLLIPRFAATGAALAYATSVCLMYGTFALMANRELRHLRDDVEQVD